MSESSMTPHTAPRTLEGLLKETPFKLRLLVGALGALTSEEDKMAWHNMSTPDARANYVLGLLQAWDKANPGAAAQASVPQTNGASTFVPAQQPQQTVPVQMVQPMQVAPMVATVAPGALAAATAATTEKPKRNPRTQNTDSSTAAADLGVNVIDLLTRVLNGQASLEAKYEAFTKQVTGIIEDAANSKTSRVAAMENNFANVAKALEGLIGGQQSMQQVQVWTLMCFLTFMQESMGASTVDILRAAISDSAQLQQLVNKATGKA